MRVIRISAAVLMMVAAAGLAVAAPAVAAPVVAAPVAAHPAPVAAIGPGTAVTGVDDFTFASFEADYELGRDGEDRSTLRTTEHFVALFPDIDQNRGIKRAIPTTYQGHPLQIDDLRVTDQDGHQRDSEREFDDGFLVLTIAVPEGEFVHGEQHYVIQYTQRDVTRFFDQTADGVDADEFYWDTNGTGWAQPFQRVTATVTLAPELVDRLTGAAKCYYGPADSTTECDITADGDTVTASVSDLGGYQNMTVAIGFEPGTFAPAPFELTAWVPWPVLAGLGAGILAVLSTLVLRFGPLRDARGRGTVIAQYEPPPGMSALLAANLIGRPTKGMAATIVDLAVRRKLRILERQDPDGGAKPSFGLQRMTNVGDPDLVPAEQAAFQALFAWPDVDVKWMAKSDTVLGQQVVNLTKATNADAETKRLRRTTSRWPFIAILLLGLVSFGLCLVGGIVGTSETAIIAGVLGSILVAFIIVGALIALAVRRPLTRAGAEAVEHLEGLKLFIRLAEADRLRMLQSVSGAERGPADAGGASVVRVYERLLPYAVLFGLENQWAAELAKYYPESSPDWYEGSNMSSFNVAVFASSIGSFSSSVSTSYSGSNSSSSSGGSGGGGSSGGGGGGGGGGGV